MPLLRWHPIADLDEVQARRRNLWGIAHEPDTSGAATTPSRPGPAQPTAQRPPKVEPVPPSTRTGLRYLRAIRTRRTTRPKRAPPGEQRPQHAVIAEAGHMEPYRMSKYLSPEWVERGRVQVEQNERFKSLSAGIQASILCVVHEQPAHADEVFFIDFNDGHIRDIYSGAKSEFDKRGVKPTFEVHGDYDTFRAIQEGHLTQATALMRGRLRLKGSLMKALKYMKTLDAVTDVLREVPTEF